MSQQVETPAELAGGTFEQTIRSKAAELKKALIDQTLNDAESWAKAVDVQWQYAHPDQPPLSPISAEEITKFRDSVNNEYYEWVVPAFERYLSPDPDAINSMISALRSIESMFGGSQDGAGTFSPASEALGRINDVRTEMGEWEGDLQTNFIDNFLTPLQTVSLNQAAVAKLVREQLECCKILYIRYRKGILNLVNDSIEAVKTLNNGRDPKSYMWGTIAIIVVGTALTAGSGAVLAAGTVLSIAGTIAQGVTPDPPKTNELSAPTAQEVAVKISDAMIKMDQDVGKEEEKAKTAFDNIYQAISTSRSKSISSNTSGDLAVAVPAVSTAKPGDITDGSMRPRD
ncbi:MAG: hypothetical protein WCA46_16130 [Actinocatenispora sp.]